MNTIVNRKVDLIIDNRYRMHSKTQGEWTIIYKGVYSTGQLRIFFETGSNQGQTRPRKFDEYIFAVVE